MAKNNKRKTQRLKSRLNEARRGLARLRPDAQGELKAARLLMELCSTGVQRSTVIPDSPDLSPDEIDYLKALLGF